MTLLPHMASHCTKVGWHTLANTEGSAPYNITGAPRQRNTAQMQEQIKTPETEVINEEIANPSDSEFKTLVIIDAHRNG